MVILDAKDVTFTYEGDVRGVRGVSVQVSAGELVCLLGPNGAGKTTLARLLCGLLDSDSGGVAWRGQPLQGMPPRERARCVALVPQSMDRIPPVGVREFIMMGRYAHQGRFGSWTRPVESGSRTASGAPRWMGWKIGRCGRSLADSCSGR